MIVFGVLWFLHSVVNIVIRRMYPKTEWANKEFHEFMISNMEVEKVAHEILFLICEIVALIFILLW